MLPSPWPALLPVLTRGSPSSWPALDEKAWLRAHMLVVLRSNDAQSGTISSAPFP